MEDNFKLCIVSREICVLGYGLRVMNHDLIRFDNIFCY